jgi:hypothetical protein
MTTRRRFPRLAKLLGWGGGILLAGLLVLEILFRLLGISYPIYVRTDPIRGTAHIPGAKSAFKYEGRSWIEINSHGLRGPEVTVQRPPGTFRIALLGDSFIEAFEVPFEHTAGEILEQRLAALRGIPVEVLNFATGGYGTTEQLLTLKHEVWKYSPDLVLLAVTVGTDISDNYPGTTRSNKPRYIYQGERLTLDTSFVTSSNYRLKSLLTRRMLGLVQYSRVAQVIFRGRRVQRKRQKHEQEVAEMGGDEVGPRDMIHLPPATPEWKEAWRVTEGILRLAQEECRRKNTPLALVTLTRAIQVTPEREKKERFLRHLGAKDMFYPERRLAEFGKRHGMPVLNLAPPVAKLADQRQVYFHAQGSTPGIGHWNREGHRVAGELIAEWLDAQLPKGSILGTKPKAAE